MKIVREEKKLILYPESEWEYDQIKDISHRRIDIKGFENAWDDNWSLKGGLEIKLLDPYD